MTRYAAEAVAEEAVAAAARGMICSKPLEWSTHALKGKWQV